MKNDTKGWEGEKIYKLSQSTLVFDEREKSKLREGEKITYVIAIGSKLKRV